MVAACGRLRSVCVGVKCLKEGCVVTDMLHGLSDCINYSTLVSPSVMLAKTTCNIFF